MVTHVVTSLSGKPAGYLYNPIRHLHLPGDMHTSRLDTLYPAQQPCSMSCSCGPALLTSRPSCLKTSNTRFTVGALSMLCDSHHFMNVVLGTCVPASPASRLNRHRPIIRGRSPACMCAAVQTFVKPTADALGLLPIACIHAMLAFS